MSVCVVVLNELVLCVPRLAFFCHSASRCRFFARVSASASLPLPYPSRSVAGQPSSKGSTGIPFTTRAVHKRDVIPQFAVLFRSLRSGVLSPLTPLSPPLDGGQITNGCDVPPRYFFRLLCCFFYICAICLPFSYVSWEAGAGPAYSGAEPVLPPAGLHRRRRRTSHREPRRLPALHGARPLRRPPLSVSLVLVGAVVGAAAAVAVAAVAVAVVAVSFPS